MYPRFIPELDGERLAIGAVVPVAAESTKDGPGFLKRRKKKHKQLKEKREKAKEEKPKKKAKKQPKQEEQTPEPIEQDVE